MFRLSPPTIVVAFMCLVLLAHGSPSSIEIRKVLPRQAGDLFTCCPEANKYDKCGFFIAVCETCETIPLQVLIVVELTLIQARQNVLALTHSVLSTLQVNAMETQTHASRMTALLRTFSSAATSLSRRSAAHLSVQAQNSTAMLCHSISSLMTPTASLETPRFSRLQQIHVSSPHKSDSNTLDQKIKRSLRSVARP